VSGLAEVSPDSVVLPADGMLVRFIGRGAARYPVRGYQRPVWPKLRASLPLRTRRLHIWPARRPRRCHAPAGCVSGRLGGGIPGAGPIVPIHCPAESAAAI